MYLKCFQSSHFLFRRDQRDDTESVDNQQQSRNDSRSSCRKKRRRAEQLPINQSPEFIDLTEVADHDDSPSVRVLEEMTHSPYLDTSVIIDHSRFVFHFRDPVMIISKMVVSRFVEGRQRFLSLFKASFRFSTPVKYHLNQLLALKRFHFRG